MKPAAPQGSGKNLHNLDLLLAPGKLNYLPVPGLPYSLTSQACAPAVLFLSYLFNHHLLSLLPSRFISASAHRPFCIFSIFYLSLCIVLFTLWLALCLFMYLIFPITKRLREQGLYLRHIYFLQSTQNSA